MWVHSTELTNNKKIEEERGEGMQMQNSNWNQKRNELWKTKATIQIEIEMENRRAAIKFEFISQPREGINITVCWRQV